MAEIPFNLLTEYPTHADALREIERLRTLGDALAEVLRSGSDREWDSAIDDWEEARRG